MVFEARENTYRWNIETGNAEASCRSGDHNELVQDNVRLLLVTALVNSLVADSIDSTVDHLSTVELNNLLNRVALGEVDTLTSDLSCSVQSLLDLINDEHSASSSQNSGVSGHQTYRAGTEDCYGVTRLEAG